jgi:hypothetical protein
MFIDKGAEKQAEHFKYGINQWTGEPNKPVFYTKEMALKIRDIHRPAKDLQMDIVKYPDFLAIRLYEDNFKQYDGSLKMQVIEYVEMVKNLLESYGVRCELEGKPGGAVLR